MRAFDQSACAAYRKAVKLLAAGLLTLSASPAFADPPAAAVRAGFSKVIFNEDFDSLDVSPDGGGKHRWYNGLWYQPAVARDRFELTDGLLRISTHIKPIGWATGSAITTWPKKPGGSPTLFHYGYFEARMRFKPGQYNWPAFWLLAAHRTELDKDRPKGSWCEIDIYEGGKSTDFQGTLHGWVDGHSVVENKNQHFRLPAGADYTHWNTFGLLWQQGKVTWYFNGIALGSADTPASCNKQKQFMIIGAQKRAGGTSPESVDVDWVRVYR